MANQLSVMTYRARRTLAGFTSGQIAVVVLVTIALAVAGIFWTKLSAAPMSPMFTNLSTQDAAAIVDQLNSDGTPYQLEDGGTTILVPQDKVYTERLKMSGQGLPSGSQNGSTLTTPGVGTSSTMEALYVQKGLESELAKTIESISGVQAAAVHLALPKADAFTTDTSVATASVMVTMRSGGQLTSDQATAIENLVASSVPQLTSDKVTLTDSRGRMYSGSGSSFAGGSSNNQMQATNEVDTSLGQKAQSLMDLVAGPGNAAVAVNATLDFDTWDRKTQTVVKDPVVPVSQATSTETYTGNGNVPGGVVGGATGGTPSNGNTKNQYSKTTTQVTNSVGSIIENRTGAPGAIKRMTVAVMLNQATAGKLDKNALSSLVSNAVGLDTTRGDTIDVQVMQFDQTAINSDKAAADAAASDASKAMIFDIARKVGIAILVLAVLGLAFLSSRRQEREELDDEWLKALGPAPFGMDVSVGVPVGARAGGAEALDSGPGLLALDPAEGGRLAIGADVDADVRRRALEKQEVGDLVSRQPDQVAQLMRGWLADRRQ
jgi:flagellar M-ring protein FliF